MKNNQKLMLVSLCTAAFLLGGCATSPVPEEGPTEPEPDAAPDTTMLTPVPTNYVIGFLNLGNGTREKEPPKFYLKRRNQIRPLLKSMSRMQPGARHLGERLAKLRNEHAANPVPALSSLGSGYASALLRAVDGQYHKQGRNIGKHDPTRDTDVKLKGLIREYDYDPTDSSGRLVVETETLVTHQGATVRTDFHRWTVRIEPGGFTEVPVTIRGNQHFFHVPIEQDRTVIKNRGFNWKLWAGPKYGSNGRDVVDGTGGKIIVEEVYLKRDDLLDPSQNYDGVLPGHDPAYIVAHDNCIDIMFKVSATGRLPTNIGELDDYRKNGNYNYCLGRCKNPALINTGE